MNQPVDHERVQWKMTCTYTNQQRHANNQTTDNAQISYKYVGIPINLPWVWPPVSVFAPCPHDEFLVDQKPLHILDRLQRYGYWFIYIKFPPDYPTSIVYHRILNFVRIVRCDSRRWLTVMCKCLEPNNYEAGTYPTIKTFDQCY